MARAVLVACVVACFAFGTFAAPAPAASSCSDDFSTNLNNVAPGSISQFAQLLKAVDISVPTATTIFAPSDAAVQGALAKLGLTGSPSSWTPAETAIGTQLLKYHIAPGVQQSTSSIGQYGASFKSAANNLPLCKKLADKQDKDNTDNFDALKMLKDGKTYSVQAGFNVATIIKPDLNSTCLPQIIVHVIDAVLLPCSIEVITAGADAIVTPSPKPSPKLSPAAVCKTLAQVAVNVTKDTAAQEIAALVDDPTFKGTVFMPSEDALRMARNAVLAATGGSQDPTIVKTIDIIKNELNSYHVVPDTIISGDVTVETPLVTLLAQNKNQKFCTIASNGKISLIPASATKTEVSVKGAGGSANVIMSVKACNGWVHKIDTLLLPCPLESSILSTLPAANATDSTGPTPPGLVTTPGTGTGTPPTTKGTNSSATPTFVSGNNSASSNVSSAAKDIQKAKGAGAATLPSVALAVVATVAALLL